ncbi:SUMF1/EgtB/PvdO family nonheme iron enzyme [Methylobacterium sp. C25]|uniref:SUMF1/EgtB/PvdO family nonheme iron enzyme n=1 Tax=Methylobacterium sp. C25 TaxID=2721622 RepID=UPI001F370A80|nr:SUMF1/EgtB/PvdO family nonheme iron enzyme [Methylobacterium sp. C25]MCE4223531.1 SUMF1/EgtB/PvdO family nonheme iron enzyme [Methylobacterium sp. C25]
MRKRLATGLALLLLLVISATVHVRAQQPPSADSGSRIALLLGNDLQGIGAQLGRLGFATTMIENADKRRMAEAVRSFVAKARNGSTTLFLFRGAMLRLGQSNILLPSDARGGSEEAARSAGIDLNAIESDLSRRGASIKIIIVDAPRSGAVVEAFGLPHGPPAALELHEGTLAIVNASTDSQKGSQGAAGDAADPFLPELQRQTAIANVTLEQAFAKTRNAVAKATAGRQVPLVSSSLLSDFYITANVPAAAPSSSGAATDADATAKAAAPQAGETFRDCDTCPELVVVPSGEFAMGSTDSEFEKPQHRVTLAKPFAVGRYEVTFAQWDACAAAKACRADIDDHGFGRADRPVIDVSWDEAQVFVKWLSSQTKQAYRLPSEAEWEYAARAGSRSVFPWGAAAGNAKANCDDCSSNPSRTTLPVGSFRPNAFGLFDTAGNAAEWVDDCWNGSYRSAPSDGSSWRTGQCQMRVLRGGAFANKANAARSSARFRYDRDVRYYTNGFRVARDL